jgi:hypothetical protein
MSSIRPKPERDSEAGFSFFTAQKICQHGMSALITFMNNYFQAIIGIILTLIPGYIWFNRLKESDLEPHGSNLLIIDGCNGPLKFNKMSLLDESKQNISLRQKCISLLRVQNGQIKSESRYILQRKVLERLFNNRYLALNALKIYFDGRGMKEIQNRSWQDLNNDFKNEVEIVITHQKEEVDDVIVRLVKQRMKHQPITHSTALDDLKSDSNLPDENSCILTLFRNNEGAGKSKNLLKTFCLVRSGSIYSFPFMTPGLKRKSLNDVQKLLENNSKLFQDRVQSRNLTKNDETILVTDDVFLRQRILEAGGVVLTFEQLWCLLS